jgi:hypothetical protein
MVFFIRLGDGKERETGSIVDGGGKLGNKDFW